MLTLQILNTDITYMLAGTDDPDWRVKEADTKRQLQSRYYKTKVLVVETNEILTVEDIFGR